MEEHVAHEVYAVHVAVGLALLDGIVAVEGEEVVVQALGKRRLPGLELVDEVLELRRGRPRELALQVFGAGPARDLAPDVGCAHAVADDANLAHWQCYGGHALRVVKLGRALGLAKDKVLALAGQLDGHVGGRQRPLASLAAAEERVHQEAGPGSSAAHLGLDELLARRHAIAWYARLARQVHDLDQTNGHAQVYPRPPPVAGAPVMARQHQQRLHAADGGCLEVLLQDLAGMGGIGIAGRRLSTKGRGRLLHESAHTLHC